jgi:hypothetical protein
LTRSTRDLLNTLATITGRKAGFRSLGDTWADTTTSHGRLGVDRHTLELVDVPLPQGTFKFCDDPGVVVRIG